jgi:hypothetical protein
MQHVPGWGLQLPWLNPHSISGPMNIHNCHTAMRSQLCRKSSKPMYQLYQKGDHN